MSAQSSSEMDNSNNNENTTENSEKAGEKKRKKAMEEKKRSYLESKSVINEALSSLDDEDSVNRVNKKIKFADSDEYDGCDEKEKGEVLESKGMEKKKKSLSADTDAKNTNDTSSDKKKYKKKSDSSDKKSSKKTKSAGSNPDNELDKEKPEEEEARKVRRRERRKLLFGDSDESDSDIEFDFSKKKNREFVQLQSNLATDARFVLDDRFVESYSEESVGEGLSSMNINEPDDEKKRQLDVLQSVLGQQTSSTANSVVKKESKPEGVRYDPLIKDHSKFEMKSVKKGVPGNKSTVPNEEAKKDESTANTSKTENVQENDPATAEGSKYYHVDGQLIRNLQSDNATDFSLLQMFGNPTNKDKDEENTGESTSIPTKGKKRPALIDHKNPFKYDSSESESEEHKRNDKSDDADADADDDDDDYDGEDDNDSDEYSFFLSDVDPRVLEGFNLFRTGSMITTKGFKEMRVKLKALLKKRAHNNAKKEAKTKDSAKKTKYS